jgi:hypothetical protein
MKIEVYRMRRLDKCWKLTEQLDIKLNRKLKRKLNYDGGLKI